jgi:hypothetical protein
MAQNEIITVRYNSGDIVIYDLAAITTQLPFGQSLLTEARLALSNIDDGLCLYLHANSFKLSEL